MTIETLGVLPSDRAGGTWMGITREGRFAAVTNYRDPADKRSTALSRGELVTQYLSSRLPPHAFVAQLSGRLRDYNAFNLILCDGDALVFFGSREGTARDIAPGVHGLSNHLLDEPWPKVRRGRETMRRALEQARGVKKDAAELMGISQRALSNYLAKYRIES